MIEAPDAPATRRRRVGSWPAVILLLVASAMICAADRWSREVLHLNAARAVAETLTASMTRNEAAARAGRARRPRIDPLNPSTWSLERQEPDSDDTLLSPREAERIERARRQIVAVEVAVPVWKWTVRVAAGLILVTGLGAFVRPDLRGGLYAVAGVVLLAAFLVTNGALYLLPAYAGLPPPPLEYYLGHWVALAAGAFLLICACSTRRGSPVAGPADVSGR